MLSVEIIKRPNCEETLQNLVSCSIEKHDLIELMKEIREPNEHNKCFYTNFFSQKLIEEMNRNLSEHETLDIIIISVC